MTPSLTLPSELTIYTVGELRPQWLTWLASLREQNSADSSADTAMLVDAEAVGEIDAAGVQLLLSLSHALQREHHVLQLHNPSRPLAAACDALGVQALLAGSAAIGATP